MKKENLSHYVKRLKRKLKTTEKERKEWMISYCRLLDEKNNLQKMIQEKDKTINTLLYFQQVHERLIGEKQNQIDKLLCKC